MADDLTDRLNTALEDRYRVEQKLGEGGMATVYLAEDRKHERQVALKVLRPELAAVIGADRFLAEIKTTAKLQHPNILPLHDSGEADGFLFYVMPYVEGESLRDRLERDRQLPVEEAVRIASEVAEALEYAHEHGVIHRDVKPENILLHAGRPLVADFGIALAVNVGGGHRMTETGLSLGTPHYMSPEQATGDAHVGPGTDVYALGCVLYEMLVGDPPYIGSTPQMILGKIISGGPASATEVRSAVPANVDAVIRKALEKLPADRFGSAADFRAALADPGFRHGAEMAAAGARGRSSRPVGLAGWGVATVLAVALGWTALQPDPEPLVRQSSLAVGQGMFPVEWLALSPDGSSLVMAVRDAAGLIRLAVRRSDELDFRVLPGTDRPADPIVSPDGREVAYASSQTGELMVASLDGGSPRPVAQGAGCCLRWSDDGFIYYQGPEGGISRVSDRGGMPEPVTEPEDPEQHVYFHRSADGGIGLFSNSRPGVVSQIVAMDMESGRQEVLAQGIRSYLTPNNDLVFLSSDGRLMAAPFDAGELRLASSPVPVIENIGMRVGDGMYTLSASGDFVFWRAQVEGAIDQRELVWVTRSGETMSVASDWKGQFEFVALSPDGSRLAVNMGVEDNSAIWMKELDGTPPRMLTFEEGSNRRPAWTPDGRSVIFISDRQGDTRDVWSLDVDGVAAPELLLDRPITVDEAVWSNDGQWLVHRTGRSGEERDLFAWRAGPDSLTVPASTAPVVDEVSPALSPDGNWLAYVSNETGQYEVWIRPFPETQAGRRQISVEGGTEPVWSRDGRELFYRSQGRMMAVSVQTAPTFSTGEVRDLFSTTGYQASALHASYDVSLDGSRFLMIRQPEASFELIHIQNFFQLLEERLGN
jgi:serine/threonine-protein kinase